MSDFTSWVEKNKSLWARVYDEVIAPDFEKEWKIREEGHQQELKRRDENQQLLFNHISEQTIKNTQVIEENQRLEVELQQRVKDAVPLTNPNDAATASMDASKEEHRHLTEKYDELNKKYQDLSQKVKYLERKNTTVMQKNREMKDSVRAWQQYADRQKPHPKPKGTSRAEKGPSKLSVILQNEEEVPPHMPSSPTSVNSKSTPLQRVDQSCISPTPATNIETGDDTILSEGYQSADHAATPKGPVAMNFDELEGVSHNDISFNTRLDRSRRYEVETNGMPSSSQTTVDEAPDQLNRRSQAVHVDDEDDLLQVVSERSLKRKRVQQPRIGLHAGRSSDGTPAKPHRVKDEPLSSPPRSVYTLLRTETIDLDDPAANKLEAALPSQRTTIMYSNASGTIRNQRSSSAPFSQATNQQVLQREHRAGLRSFGEQDKLQIAAADMWTPSEPPDQCANEQVLQPLDPNIVVQMPEVTSNKRSKQATARRSEHGILAESGELPPPMDENELRLPPSAARARLQKLRAAKDTQTPKRRLQCQNTSGSHPVKQEQVPYSPIATSRTEQSPSGLDGSRRLAAMALACQQEDTTLESRPTWSMHTPDKRSMKHKHKLSPPRKQARLREKPVKELRVHDFKPNPAYNQGYSYAFSETVRKRGDRMCLPGCTNPRCCGSHFRHLAEALDSLSASQEEELLEDYLGDAYTTVISTQMSSDERAELVLQARTKKMANDNGKHREAYERRQTPPGFWRVDFPTTQEQEDDRGRAKEQEVRIVQERWLEAQKKGGRWIFRDD
ncbi:DNA repair protein endonuclease SAE2/CtIP C-terminus-domain-containing protein [Boeremia exigua]|uniref:DNA repair protein endonuclease SAE2/CtIP C-terminus-domain-containing protein n=1 Tax=Boeremia exigua TaxID=749465 RepID=UPI001E8CFDFA|nr:DNA repair protein endonuclease SAE2/CtIP C-terminus-domain-containing protein [Boeremia exigua]KAH6642433.1 DNA repair protein endonuclease SAE2/CtIP C-terminus-domain-containing protein [Boeremia exigua]